MTRSDRHDLLQEQLTSLEEELTELMEGTIGVPSPPGYEKNVCVFLEGWMNEHGIPASIQDIEETRANVVGVIPGVHDGPSLTLNAHMDTTFVGDASDVPIIGSEASIAKPYLAIDDDHFIGLGVFNDKGLFVAACIGALAIRRAGIALAGDLVLAGVCGEIGRGQVADYRGPGTRGKGLGTYHLLHQGVWTDYAIVCENSNWSISWALPGAAYYQIAVRGEPTYAPLSDRTPSSAGDSRNAIVKAAHLIIALEEWAETYEASNELATPCGVMRPRVTIGAIDGGLPYKPNWRPGLANVYLDVRIPPNRTPLEVKREVESTVRATGLSTEVNMYLARRGYVGQGVEPIVGAMQAAHHEIFSGPPNPAHWRNLSTWNDTNIYAEVGIPAVKYGPPGSLYPERVKIEDVMNAARVYALSALNLCGMVG